MALKRTGETADTITFRDGDREFTVAKRGLKGTTLQYATGGIAGDEPVKEPIDWAGLKSIPGDVKAALSPRSWHQTISAQVPWPTANSIPAKGIAGLRSLVPGRGTYEEELAAYNAEAPSVKQQWADTALTVIPAGKIVGAVAKPLLKGVGKAAKVAKAAPRRFAVGTIPWEQMSKDEAVEAALSNRHLSRAADGQYIGAPRGVNTPQKLEAMRRMVDAAVDTGGFGAGWYERAKGTLLVLTDGRPEQARQLAKQLAIYSVQNKQRPNLGMAVKAWNQNALGGPELVRSTADMPRKGAEARSSASVFEDPSSMAGLGRKTGNYANQLDPGMANAMAIRAVNDLWVGRAYGYAGKSKWKRELGIDAKKTVEGFDRGFTQQEHSFLTGENLLAAQRASTRGLIPPENANVPGVQAALWVAERFRFATKKHPEWSLERRMAFANESPTEAVMGDPKLGGKLAGEKTYVANETTEATPGAPGHLAGMADQQDLKLRMSADPRSNYLTESGRDMFHEATGTLQLPAEKGMGTWLNPDTQRVEQNPNLTLHPLVSYAKKRSPTTVTKSRPAELDPASKTIMEQTNAWRSALDAQSQGAYNAPGRSGRLMQLPWDEAEGTGRVTRTLMEGGVGPEAAPGLGPSVFQPLDKRLAAKWDAHPALLQRIGEKNALDQEMAAAGGQAVSPPRKDIMLLRAKLAEKGWTGLAEHVEKYGYAGLPAAVVGSLEVLRQMREPDAKD